MATKYTVIQNFKYGLDGRKSVLTSVPGTLVQCQNAHINAGGEIEQRMSFVKDATAYPSATFGLQDTDSGLMTFGSVAPGTNGQTTPLPTGVVYQQLLHPTGYYLSSGTPTALAMTGVLFSCNYNGKAFVIAQFTDNSVFCYYNGSLVLPSRSGIVLVNSSGVETNANLSTDLAALVNTTISGWSAVANSGANPPFGTQARTRNGSNVATLTLNVTVSNIQIGDSVIVSGVSGTGYNGTQSITGVSTLNVSGIPYVAISYINVGSSEASTPDTGGTIYDQTYFAENGSTIVQSPAGVHLTVTPSDVSASSGEVGAAIIDQNYAGIAPQSAMVAFTFNSGTTGTVTLTAPEFANGSGTAQLTGGAISFDTSLAKTAQDVATAVNKLTYITGYSAILNSTTVTIIAPASFGAVTFNLTVTYTGDFTFVGGTVQNQFSIIVTPTTLSVIKSGSTHSKTLSGTVSVQASGPLGVVTYAWVECNSDGSTPVTTASGILLSSATQPTAGFSKTLSQNQSVQGYFKITATDTHSPPAIGSPASQIVGVYFEYDSLN